MGNCNKKQDELVHGVLLSGIGEAHCRELPRHHDRAINSIAMAKTGEIITCGIDKTICLLDWRAGVVRRVWRGHTKSINKVVYCPATDRVFSCSRDMTIKQWRREGEGAMQSFTHDLTVSAIDVNHDGRRLCSGSRDVSVRVWDVEAGTEVMRKKIPRNVVTCVKWFKGEDCFVQGSEDLHLRIWDSRVKPWEPVHTWAGYTYFPLCVDVSEDGTQVLTSSKGFNSEGAEAKVWDRRMGKVVREAKGHAQDATSCLFFNTSIKPMIVTASKDETLRTWNLHSMEEECTFTDPEGGGTIFTDLSLIGPVEDSTERACLAASTFNGGLYILRQDATTRQKSQAVRVGLTCIAKIPPMPLEGGGAEEGGASSSSATAVGTTT